MAGEIRAEACRIGRPVKWLRGSNRILAFLSRLLRFPRNSLSYRLSPVFELIFSSLALRHAKSHRTTTRYRFLTFTGRHQLPMLRASLWSLSQSATELPAVVVACDATVSPDDVLEALAWWPAPVQIWPAAELLDHGRRILPARVLQACGNSVFALKLCALAHAARLGMTIYADTDVLWFGDPANLIAEAAEEGSYWMQTQQDAQMAYDASLLTAWPYLKGPPFHCAGVVVLKGDIGGRIPSVPALVANEARVGTGQFTEQTILAATCRTTGMMPLPASQAFIGWEDRLRMGPSFVNRPWILRHYVGPVRHLFWRDACFLRVRKSRSSHTAS